ATPSEPSDRKLCGPAVLTFQILVSWITANLEFWCGLAGDGISGGRRSRTRTGGPDLGRRQADPPAPGPAGDPARRPRPGPGGADRGGGPAEGRAPAQRLGAAAPARHPDRTPGRRSAPAAPDHRLRCDQLGRAPVRQPAGLRPAAHPGLRDARHHARTGPADRRTRTRHRAAPGRGGTGTGGRRPLHPLRPRRLTAPLAPSLSKGNPRPELQGNPCPGPTEEPGPDAPAQANRSATRDRNAFSSAHSRLGWTRLVSSTTTRSRPGSMVIDVPV